MPRSTAILEIQYSAELAGLVKTGIDSAMLDKIFYAIAEKIGVTAGSLVSPPPVARHIPLPVFYKRERKNGAGVFMSKFKSKEQQGYFFAVVLEGDNFPYTRGRGSSEQLTAQLGLLPFTITRQGNSWIVEAGVNASYAPLVVGSEDEQSHYHKDVWTPLEDDILSDSARRLYLTTIQNELKSAIDAFT